MALLRLNANVRKLQGNTKLALEYHQNIQEWLDTGVIEEAQPNPGELEHYLAHHPVITKKLRIVIDASARLRGRKSLNDWLYRGPVLMPELVGLLMRFRRAKYYVLADIEKAFLQVKLREEDREVVKFLWIKDPLLPATPKNLIIYHFCRIPFGVISSPFLLAAVIRKHLAEALNPLADEIARNAYVDNILMEVSSTEEAV